MTSGQLVLSIGGDERRCYAERLVFWRWLLVVLCVVHGVGWAGRWQVAS